jgi:hypothetical protein
MITLKKKEIYFMSKKEKNYWNKKIYVNNFFLLIFSNKFKLGRFILEKLNFFNNINIFKTISSIKYTWMKPFYNHILKKFFLENNMIFPILTWIKEMIVNQFIFISQKKIFFKILKKFTLILKNFQNKHVFFDLSFFLSKIMIQISSFKKIN